MGQCSPESKQIIREGTEITAGCVRSIIEENKPLCPVGAIAGTIFKEFVWAEVQWYRPQLKTEETLDTMGVLPGLGSKWLSSLVSQEQQQVLSLWHIFGGNCGKSKFPSLFMHDWLLFLSWPFSHFHLDKLHFPPYQLSMILCFKYNYFPRWTFWYSLITPT